tara:strand:+ start:922 stop:1275 length:354 start_codon:yes stop_codon:yes gene_type:complete
MYLTLERINSIEELELVVEEGKKDNHNLFNPTHVVKKGDNIVGAWSLCGIPFLTAWIKTDAINKRENLQIQSIVDSLMSEKGQNQYLIACDKDSKYAKFMERVGYKHYWETVLYIKE